MSKKDQLKWDKKYKETPKLLEDRQPSEKLPTVLQYTQGKNALDVACGAGKNALYLAQHEFSIDAMDISQVALQSLTSKNIPNITAHIVDLETFSPTKDTYDLIVQTNYLDRALIPKLIQGLKKNGILFIETYMFHEKNEKAPSNKSFLLQANELKELVPKNMKIIEYDEFFNPSYELYTMRKQSIIAQKID